MVIIFFSLLIGLAIGVLLEKSNILDPEVVFKQFMWKDFTLLKVVLIAIATSMLVFSVLNFSEKMLIESFSFSIIQIILGGIFLGFGVLLTGTIPIAIMAQIGIGYIDAIFIFFGVIFGGLFYRLIEPILPYIEFLPKLNISNISTAFELDYWIVAPIFSILLLFIVYCLRLIERRTEKPAEEEEEEIDW